MPKLHNFKHPIIGQECTCPDGVGRVANYKDNFPHQWIKVDTYYNNKSSHWDPDNVKLYKEKLCDELFWDFEDYGSEEFKEVEYSNNYDYFHIQVVSSKTWTVTHNLGKQFVIVQIKDIKSNVITPDEIIFENSSTTLIKFEKEIMGSVEINKGESFQQVILTFLNILKNLMIK